MNETNISTSITHNETKKKDSFKVKAAIFLSGITGMSAIIGFSATLAAVKKQDPKHFNKAMVSSIELRESGASLALRALGWGTLYAVTGCGILFYTIWKISGAQNFDEFRYKAGSILPKIPKSKASSGRSEFRDMNDLFEYLQNVKSSTDE